LNKEVRVSIYGLLISILLTCLTYRIDSAWAELSDGRQDAVEQEAAARPASQKKAFILTITGNSQIPDNDLIKAAAIELGMFEQRGFRKADIDDAAFQMRSAYLAQGFAFAFVDYSYEKKDNRVAVTFTVDEGPRVTVERLDFTGNTHVGPDKLHSFFPSQPSGWGRHQAMFFVESEVKDAVGRIREYYRGEGYIDARVQQPSFLFSEDRTKVLITLNIEEGPRYRIKDVMLTGDLLPELAGEFEDIKKNLIGVPYFVRRKLLLRTRLDEAYDAIGYADAEFEIKAEKLAEQGSINLLAAINKGEQIRIDRITISGNASTREEFIRHRVQLKPGDIYTKAKRTGSFRKLYDSGLFSKITIELAPSGNDASRDLVVTVEELPTREYYLEPGWGSYEELRLGAGIFEKNLFGTGRYARLDGLISTKSEMLTISYTDPLLLQTDLSMNVPLFYENREEPSYTSEQIGLTVLFSRKFGSNLTLATGYQYKITQLFSLADDSPIPRGEDDYIKGTVGVQAIWDTRDDIFYPAEGLRLASSFDISLPAFGSDLEYGRITLGCRYFIELPQEYIIGLRATTGLIIPIRDQDYIPISERFFNGGDTTVRSYEHSELGPKDDNNEPIGGLGYNVFSVELRKRFYKNFATTLYVDAGNVSPNRSLYEKDFVPYTSRSDLLDDTLNDFFSEFKYGVGIGFQYLLPVGPIRFDIAYNPDPEEIWQEDSWVYHFSLGMAF